MDVYSGEAKYIGDYFQPQGYDFIIPEYQREFSWEKDNISQLFLDLANGVIRIKSSDTDSVKKSEKSKFLGCIIQWLREAEENKDYYPHSNKHVTNIREIIDGQQRTSSLLLIFVRYYYYFDKQRKQLKNNSEEKIISAFIKKIVLKSWLFNNFAINVPPKNSKEYRPALIRQETDIWYVNKNHAKYISPISKYLFDTINAIKDEKNTKVLNEVSSLDSNTIEVIKAIDLEINTIFEKTGFSALNKSYTLEDLFGIEFEDEYEDANIDFDTYLSQNLDRNEVMTPIINNLSVLHYLLNYCAFTVISSPTESAALDMFQSLNSSGVQLTALQMLKPNLSSDFRQHHVSFSNSETSIEINDINNWFNADGRSRERKLKQFFLKFCMLFSGDDAPTSLSLQRSWVQKTYSNFTNTQVNTDKSSEYIEYMYSTKEYLSSFLMKSKQVMNNHTKGVYQNYKLSHPKFGDNQLSDTCITCLMYLSDANHELLHPLLIRFYHQYRITSTLKEANNAQCEFETVVNACASIFTMFRVGFNKHPDSFYKKIYEKSFSIIAANKLTAIQTLYILRKNFYLHVKEVHKSKKVFNKFIEQFAINSRYGKFSNHIIRFILINNSNFKINGSVTGLQDSNIVGSEILTPKTWLDENLASIEHICPQDASKKIIDHWCTGFISSTKIDDIGNLTLLSQSSNSSIGEKVIDKLQGYENYLNPGSLHKIQPVVTHNSSTAKLQPHLIAVVKRLRAWQTDIEAGILPSNSQYEWDPDFIVLRSKNIAQLVLWDFYKSLRV
ncbi:DUF262 domain-containing protein [Colwellia sp. C1TZA3]|uniref:DUF262 domain-containing protein n=1 Tax=Colwellia sp. C1TZA3 TaxID=2508879 RepID=UPI0011B96F73|nr:DUF262 domain-containing protein [Colwellia sp. C1TZA3]TWX72209.1 DUF262 domain-containing protein [Colwellia sp. C1TZA3]